MTAVCITGGPRVMEYPAIYENLKSAVVCPWHHVVAVFTSACMSSNVAESDGDGLCIYV